MEGLQLSVVRVLKVYSSVLAVSFAGLVGPAFSQQEGPMTLEPSYYSSRTWDEMTPAEHTTAKAEAKVRKIKTLRVCADPGNLPMSNQAEEGYQNKIARLLADKLGAKLKYFWRPYIERGLTSSAFGNDECDILLGLPTGFEGALTTEPVYRTTYVLAWRTDRDLKITSFDDPRLRGFKIGTFQLSGIREVLARHGVSAVSVHAIQRDDDLVPENQAWRQVQRVVDRQLDVAAVWGPFAGYVKHKLGQPITIHPVNLMDDQVQLEFEISIGVRPKDVVLKYMLDNALNELRSEIDTVLRDYGVPLVSCSKCAVQGELPSHGTYFDRFTARLTDRYLKPSQAARPLGEGATSDQIVSSERFEGWLEDGADLLEELVNASTSGDHTRIRLLIKKGADVNGRVSNGLAPIHTAAVNRDDATIKLLVELGGDVHLKDTDGWSAIHHAVYRNHVPSVEVLAKLGANMDVLTQNNLTPMALGLGEAKFYAVAALIRSGANPDGRFGKDQLTPLMVLATQKPAPHSARRLVKGPPILALAKALVDKGADVNALSTHGITPLMIAAGHDNPQIIAQLIRAGADTGKKSKSGRTAFEIAKKAKNKRAAKALERLSKPHVSN